MMMLATQSRILVMLKSRDKWTIFTALHHKRAILIPQSTVPLAQIDDPATLSRLHVGESCHLMILESPCFCYLLTKGEKILHFQANIPYNLHEIGCYYVFL